MYNRYIPQPDGSYQRSRYPEKLSPLPPSRQTQERTACEEPKPPESVNQPQKPPVPHHPHPARPCRPAMQKQEKAEPCGIGIGSFLRQLLPGDFDTGDLIVVLLLLLMSSDCREEQNTALLTLALYLFL